MKTEHKIFVALGLLVVLAIGLYVTKRDHSKEESEHTATAASADFPAISLPKDDSDKITKLEITTPKKDDKDKLTVVLEKKGDTWEVTQPVQAKANQANVKSAVDGLKDLKIQEVIEKSASSYPEYELSDDKATHVVAYKGGEKAIDLYFGKSGSRGQMVRIAGKDGVYTAKGYSNYVYGREVKNWRETQIAKFEDENVIQADIVNKNGKLSFSKNGDKWSGSFTKRDKDGKLDDKPQKEWKNFDDSKVKSFLSAYKSLNANDFADGKADTGVEKAGVDNNEGGVVHFKLKDNAGDVTIKVGKTAKGSDRYAIKDGGDGTVYVLSSWSADWAVANKDKFEKPDDKKKDKDKDKKEPAPAHGGDEDD